MSDAPTSPQPADTIRFYFSFRSPYAWLAMHRIDAAISGTGLTVEYIPVYPPSHFPNDPAKVPAKLKYIMVDFVRIARAYGLSARAPDFLECNWMKPHAAFLCAQDQGKGVEFAKAVYTARFTDSEDLDDDNVIADCARAAGLSPAPIVAAQTDAATQARVTMGMLRGGLEDDLFGVPYFVYRGERFWGNDRVEWLLRRVAESRGLAVPDLSRELIAPVHRQL